MNVIGKVFFSAVLIGASFGPVYADPPSQPKRPALDPNQKICEDVTATGSRLSTKRVCGTRAEWAEKRKQDKDVIDDAQRSAAIGCSVINTHTGTPSC